MTSKAGAALDYGTTSPKHGVKTYGSASYTYDANGSMTAKGDLSIKYDPERRPVRVQDSGTIYRVVYDGDGVRRKRLDENGTIHYLGDYERNVGNGSDTTEVVTKYYYATLGAMTRLIAFRRAGTLHWVGSDHLGGTIRVMDSSFAAVDGMRYEPYGEDRDAGDALLTDRKFTGQTQDQSIGLYWYQSRAYDPEIGRFCSPDSIVPAPGNPPALNRYSYVYNNPLKYVDPSGHNPLWQEYVAEAQALMAEDELAEEIYGVANPPIQAPAPQQGPANYYGDPPSGDVTPADQEAISGYQWQKPWLAETERMLEQAMAEYSRNTRKEYSRVVAAVTRAQKVTTVESLDQGTVHLYQNIQAPGSWIVAALNKGSHGSVTIGSQTVLSTARVEYGSLHYMHEKIHTIQAKEKGLLYLPEYIKDEIVKFFTGKPNPMEVDAKARARKMYRGKP